MLTPPLPSSKHQRQTKRASLSHMWGENEMTEFRLDNLKMKPSTFAATIATSTTTSIPLVAACAPLPQTPTPTHTVLDVNVFLSSHAPHECFPRRDEAEKGPDTYYLAKLPP